MRVPAKIIPKNKNLAVQGLRSEEEEKERLAQRVKNRKLAGQNQQPKTNEDKPMPIHVDGGIVDPGASEEVDIQRNDTETSKKKKEPPKSKPVNPILAKYCKQEGISLKYVLQKRSTTMGADAKRKVAQAIYDGEEALDYKAIAVIMDVSKSSVWGYLYADRNQDVRNDAIVRNVLGEMPETHEQLLKIAKQELRLPIDQIRFIVREYCGKEKPNA